MLKTCSFYKLLHYKVEWICGHTETQPQSEALISWALTDGLKRGLLQSVFNPVFWAEALTRHRLLCSLNIQIEVTALGAGGKAALSRCHFPAPCEVAHYRSYRLRSPFVMRWIQMTPFFLMQLVILSRFKWKATDALEGFWQISCISHAMFTPAKATTECKETLCVNTKHINT